MAQSRTKPTAAKTVRGLTDASLGFGARLRKARMAQGLTLRDLSNESKVSIAYLSDLERGVLGNPTLDILRSIASALKVSLNDLLGVDVQGGRQARYPKALEDFRALTPFREVVAEDANRRSLEPEELEDEWLQALAGIHVGGRRPKSASDYLFIFEAIRRAVDRR